MSLSPIDIVLGGLVSVIVACRGAPRRCNSSGISMRVAFRIRFGAMCVDSLDRYFVSGNETNELESDSEALKRAHRSSSHPYAFGVSLITVCSGILMYGKSS